MEDLMPSTLHLHHNVTVFFFFTENQLRGALAPPTVTLVSCENVVSSTAAQITLPCEEAGFARSYENPALNGYIVRHEYKQGTLTSGYLTVNWCGVVRVTYTQQSVVVTDLNFISWQKDRSSRLSIITSTSWHSLVLIWIAWTTFPRMRTYLRDGAKVTTPQNTKSCLATETFWGIFYFKCNQNLNSKPE